MELKSGYEIFLKNPRNADPIALSRFTFTFINIRERMLAQSELGTANSAVITENVSHIEEKYIIGDQIGSGMSGQVYKCINRETKCQCAVKIIDTKKFALTPGMYRVPCTETQFVYSFCAMLGWHLSYCFY